MSGVLARLWREQRVVLIGFVLALGLALFFGTRMVSRALYWADPAHHRQMPEAWMTPGYIARSWHLPTAALAEVLGLDRGGHMTLAEIARARGMPVEALIATLQEALPALRAQPDGANPESGPASGPASGPVSGPGAPPSPPAPSPAAGQ